MRKFVAASLVVVIAVAVAAAEEITGVITKLEGGKISVKKFKSKDEMTFTVADNVKIVNAKFNEETKKLEAGDAYQGGKEALAKRVKEGMEKAKKAADEGKKGGFGNLVFATVVTEGEGDAAKVTEIRVSKGFGGKKKNP